MSRWKFEAKLLKDDARTGYKKGRKFEPKGFYYNGKQVILIGSVSAGHATRMAFPVDAVEVEVEREFAKQKRGVVWGIWMEEALDLKAGWWCGFGERQNDVAFRTKDQKDADSFEYEEDAEDQAKKFRLVGYPCEARKFRISAGSSQYRW